MNNMTENDVLRRLACIRDQECGIYDREAIDFAIGAVKEQASAENKQVPMKMDVINYSEGTFRCPRCKCKHNYGPIDHIEFIRYCDNCGQALKF